jgi:acetolactate synthase I/II/III large subunit
MKQYCDGGEAILEAFRNLGIDYIISSPGSEWSPVWEALARQKVNQKAGPTYFECWHETLAVDMAIGYTQITGRPQAVLLHAGAGLLQGSAGMHTAMLSETPMVILSGESSTFGEDPRLDMEAQWYRSLSIVGGPHRLVEPVTKWATQAATGATLYEHVVRACEYATRTPMGPTYLDVPLETMLQDWTPPAKARKVSFPAKAQARPADIEILADQLLKAKLPMIITESAGRDPAAWAALVQLTELLGIPVGMGRANSHANFPQNHPMWLGFDSDKYVKESDLVLLVNSKAPWYPPSKRATNGTIVAISENPLKGTMVYQNLQADSYVEGDVAVTLKLLLEAVKASGATAAKYNERRERWKSEHQKLDKAAREAAAKVADQSPIHPLALVEALRNEMPADTIYVEETITHSTMLQANLNWTQPQSYFRVGGGLGQGTGFALGTKLAAPKRPVVLLVGDGSFLYNPIVQAFGASKGGDLPIIMIVFNNGKYRAMQGGHLHHYPDGVAKEADLWHGVTIDGPNYAELVKPFGLHGQTVDKPGDLKRAIAASLDAVKGGKSSVMNVMLSA